MRTIYRSKEFDLFYNGASDNLREKIDYILAAMISMKVIHSKFIKKLENTDFYEIRVSIRNEYRILLLTLDNDSFIESNRVLLLNGFQKKSTKDYKKQINIAYGIISKMI